MAATAVDLDDVTTRASAAFTRRFDGATITQLDQLDSGASSLTYRAATAGASGPGTAVVKVAPPGLDPVRNRDVLRQARVLDVLHAAKNVAVPEIYGTDPGAPPDVPPLFVMSYAPGESYEPLRTGPDGAPDDDELGQRTRAATEILAALQAPQLAESFPDEPVVTLVDEIDKWARALATVDPSWVPDLDRAEAAIRSDVPEMMDPVVLHGDWRLGNMQCLGGEVRAVIDWEIWAIGDPRLDLAWFCMMMDRSHPGIMVDRPGTPTPDSIVELYEAAAGSATRDFAWFVALTAFKQAATSALISKHAIKREQFGPADQRRVALASEMLRWSLELLD